MFTFSKTSLIRLGIALAVACAAASYGQQLTGTLSGTVFDPAQSAVPAAAVEIKNQASGDIRRSTTNTSGFFTVTGLQPGTYSIAVAAKGFDSWQQSGVVLNQGDNRT